MRIGFITSFNLVLLGILVYCNFHITNKYHEISIADKMINAQITQDKQLVSTLNAEITYLASPKYLKPLAAKYFNLVPISSKQIMPNLLAVSNLTQEEEGPK